MIQKMPTYDVTTPPKGYTEQKNIDPSISMEGVSEAEVLEEDFWIRRLRNIHRKAWEEWDYKADPVGKDTWDLPVVKWIWGKWSKRWRKRYQGDCETFARQMRKLLKRANFPPGALRIAVCVYKTLQGEEIGHAVLVVEFKGKTRISDIRHGDIKNWNSRAMKYYRWIAVQYPGIDGWVRIEKVPTLFDVVESIT